MTDNDHPPVAPKRPNILTKHGDDRVDDWYWLRDKNDAAVINHLEAENSYTAHVMSGTQSAQQRLFDEIVARIQETDLSVPVRKGDWWYYSRTEEGMQYGIHCRRKHQPGETNQPGQPGGTGEIGGDAHEQVMLDGNVEAEDRPYFALGTFDVSPDGRLLAYSTDFDGDEIFDLRFRDLTTGKNLADVIEKVSYGSAWSKDGSVVFFTRQDEAMRPFQVWRHRIGTSTIEDDLVFQEDDERFFVGVGNTRTDDFLIISSGSSLTSEIRFLRADNPLGEFKVVEPRREGVEYHVEHHRSNEHGDRFFVLTNENSPNFKLMVTSVEQSAAENWNEVIAHRDDVKLDDVNCFTSHLVLSERSEATAQIAIVDLSNNERRVLDQPETVYTARASGNPEFDTTSLRFEYTSLITPNSVFEVDLQTNQRTLLKQQPVLGKYDPAEYVTERQWATADDGTQVPISLVYRRDRPKHPGPALLYGYGSYEISIDPTFSSLRLSLLDRGFVFAIAHIRGGGDRGRLWYEHGKFFEKKNTFTDFITCAEQLIAQGLTSPEQLVIRGGSAGGLLMGAVMNMRPELFAAVVAQVPFVDALTTMLDTSLPLTVHEFEEWGNPEDPKVYEYMKSYSPYDNVSALPYPTVLVTAGLNDPRVSYWEPAKWVQRLREHSTSGRKILLKTEMGAGHQGPSGRYDSWREESFVYAFIFRSLGIHLRF